MKLFPLQTILAIAILLLVAKVLDNAIFAIKLHQDWPF